MESKLFSALQILLKKYHLTPRKDRMWGQHFLCDETVLAAIIHSAQIQPNETILEIGPGPGVLTRKLLEADARVVAIEQDRQFERLLREEFGQSFTLVVGNALTADWSAIGLQDNAFAIVANIPYSITTPLFERMLVTPRPSRAILMIQRDVAIRIAAGPKHSDRGALSVILQHQYAIEILQVVPQKAFYPPPEVESAVVRMTPTNIPAPLGFAEFVRSGFRHRRKYLRSNLLQMHPLIGWPSAFQSLGIDERARPQDVSNMQWGMLYVLLTESGPNRFE